MDTSAALKLLVAEPETAALKGHLGQLPLGTTLVASFLLHTELHCAIARRAAGVEPANVDRVLASIVLFDLVRGDLLTAAALPGRLRTNDALHLAAALRLAVDALLTYDDELSAAARRAGLAVVSPS